MNLKSSRGEPLPLSTSAAGAGIYRLADQGASLEPRMPYTTGSTPHDIPALLGKRPDSCK